MASIRFEGQMILELHEEVLFAPKGQVTRWFNGVRRELQVNTRRTAPVNKRDRKFPGRPPRGHLQRNIVARRKRIATKILGIDLISGADYSIYVIEGTHDQYRRQSGGRFGEAAGGFPLPSNNFGKFRRVQRVRGQAANNFLQRGVAITAVDHPALLGRGFNKALRRF